jgi:hypothetical protein
MVSQSLMSGGGWAVIRTQTVRRQAHGEEGGGRGRGGGGDNVQRTVCAGVYVVAVAVPAGESAAARAAQQAEDVHACDAGVPPQGIVGTRPLVHEMGGRGLQLMDDVRDDGVRHRAGRTALVACDRRRCRAPTHPHTHTWSPPIPPPPSMRRDTARNAKLGPPLVESAVLRRRARPLRRDADLLGARGARGGVRARSGGGGGGAGGDGVVRLVDLVHARLVRDRTDPRSVRRGPDR